MARIFYRSIVATLAFTLLLCVAYPLAVFAVGQIFFRESANGGLIYQGNVPRGAQLIGQAFSRPEYFHGRPSAAGNGYDAANSSGSNLGPTNQKFIDGLRANAAAVLKENPALRAGQIPTQLITASASGLDPHISREAAMVQVERVASARHISPDQVRTLVREHTEAPQWHLFGEPVVNVLLLNLALDEKTPFRH